MDSLRRISQFIGVLSILGTLTTHAQWIRKEPDNHGVIIFVHGVMGDAKSTWTSSSGSYWPEMLTQDPTFNGEAIYVYHYPSPSRDRSFTIDEVAENMRLVLTTEGVLNHSDLTFVCHSMGGIVTRAFILKYQQHVAKKIRLLFFFATPTAGTPYAEIGKFLSKNPQFGELYPLRDPDSYLGPLQSNWLAANFGIKSYCAYETQPFHGFIVVDRGSATNLCTQPLNPINADHSTIVKPTDQNNDSYRALKEAFAETIPTKSDQPHPVSSLKPFLARDFVTFSTTTRDESDMFWLLTIGKSSLCPSNLAVHMFVVNPDTQRKNMVRNIEIEGKDEKEKWVPLPRFPVGQGEILFGYDVKHLSQTGLIPLDDKLTAYSFTPGESMEGWLFAEYPNNTAPSSLRIRLTDYSNQTSVTLIPDGSPRSQQNRPLTGGGVPVGPASDYSSVPVKFCSEVKR